MYNIKEDSGLRNDIYDTFINVAMEYVAPTVGVQLLKDLKQSIFDNGTDLDISKSEMNFLIKILVWKIITQVLSNKLSEDLINKFIVKFSEKR